MISPGACEPTQDVARHYNELDPYYRQIWGLHLHHDLWLEGIESSNEAVVKLIEYVGDSIELKMGMTFATLVVDTARDRGSLLTRLAFTFWDSR